MLSFDRQSGILVAEAGVLLSDIIPAFLPHGWFPPVTPGTKFVTLGGMIAADVHGKNHHIDGSFRNFVDWLDVMDTEGVVHRCSRNEKPELFEWTIGGMGLTGIILRAGIRLRAVPSDQNHDSRQSLPNGAGGDQTTTGRHAPSTFPVADRRHCLRSDIPGRWFRL